MPPTGVDSATFRHLLGAFPSGVTVVTARAPDGSAAGMTASAFCSLSLEPPLVLVCVGLASGFHDVLRTAGRFAVNVLAEDQAALSERFAGEWSDRFTGVGLAAGEGTAPPLIGGSAAHLICATTAIVPGGDHAIFVARVLEGRAFPRRPLIHHGGGYHRLGSGA